MNDQAASPGCPDLETLTAVFDGELSPDEAVRAHFDACPDCARRLADYAILRGHVSRLVASEPDEGFDARIAAFVRAGAAKDAPRFSASKRDFSDSRAAWIFRIAALVMLSAFFVYLLTDQMHTRRAGGGRTYDVAETAAPSSGKPMSVLDAEPGAGDFVKARLVSNTPSSRQYAIDIDPMLIPAELGEIPADGSIPVPLPRFFEQEDGATRRIELHADPELDAMRMLESIRRDLTALDVPGLSVDTESRGKSLFTTIRLESAGSFDMSIRKTDGMFEFFLMSGSAPEDDGPVSFRIEFFCE